MAAVNPQKFIPLKTQWFHIMLSLAAGEQHGQEQMIASCHGVLPMNFVYWTKATPTAATVPVWMTRNKVHP